MRRRVRRHTPVAKFDAAAAASFDDFDAWIQARRGRKPGTLRDSWKVGEVEVIQAGGEIFRIDVYSLDPIAPHVEYPTIPHPIRARPGRVLSIPTPGGMAYATVVQHPGTQGSFMLATTMQETAVEWQRIVARRWRSETSGRRFWREA
jgi:hypothetical protein